MGIFREHPIVSSCVRSNGEFPRVSNRNLVYIKDARLVRPRCRRDYMLIFKTEEHKNIFCFHTETHGMTQNWFHGFTRIYTEKCLTQRRKGRGALCTFVLMPKIVAYRNHRNTQKLCSACFCESLRHLRETITHAVWVLCVPWIPCETKPPRRMALCPFCV